jgi:hypothetical protein
LLEIAVAEAIDGEFSAIHGSEQSVILGVEGVQGTDRPAVPADAALQGAR